MDLNDHSIHKPIMTPGRSALVGLMERYLAGLLDPFITLLEIHKLMYFMQESGEPLRLRYVKGLYGPYAENLRHVLNQIEGHLTVGYADGGDAPDKEIALVPGAVEDALTFLQGHADTHRRFDRVAALVAGFETSFGLELLSTVHWITEKEATHDPAALVDAFYAWSPSKQRFSVAQIELAAEHLRAQGFRTPP